MSLAVSSLSVETVAVSVTVRENGTVINPTGNTVQMAIKLNQTPPGASDWKTATWRTVSGVYYAEIDVGPGTTVGTLAPEIYEIWVRVLASPRTPVGKARTRLTVY